MRVKARRWRGCRVCVLWALLGWAASGADFRAEPTGPTDEQFVESLGDTSSVVPVDRKRLARLVFGVASTLDAGRGGVSFLHGRVVLPDASAAGVRQLLEARFTEYAAAVGGFKRSAGALLDEPESLLRWYQAHVDGQRACWALDVHQRLVETYGASATDLMGVAASRDACSLLRAAVFQPRVESIVRDALVERVFQLEEVRRLQQQVGELEQLVDDLATIDRTP